MSTHTKVIVAGYGCVAAPGSCAEALRTAVRVNSPVLRPASFLTSPALSALPLGAISRDEWERLRAGNPSDGAAFTLASSAMLEAQTHARAALAGIAPTRLGLVLSTTKASVDLLSTVKQSNAIPADALPWSMAQHLARVFCCQGPVRCVSLACTSGVAAMALGAELIRQDRADAVFVTGVDILSDFVVAGFNALKSIDPAGCRPFGLGRRGLSPGEAAAAIVLTRSRSARTNALYVLGWGTSNDANHLTGPSRDGHGLSLAIERALKHAGLAPNSVGYINAHGTGTPYNDAMEALALKTVFGKTPPPISSTKGLTGHTLGAAGVIESLICLQAMETGLLPGTAGLDIADTAAPPSLLLAPLQARPPDITLNVNAGFGGINAAILFGSEAVV